MRVALGHSQPAESPISWEYPPGYYEGRDDPKRLRCPRLDVSSWAYGILDMYLSATEMGAPPGADSRLWPSKLAAALAFLRGEYLRRQNTERKKHEAEGERKRQLQQVLGRRR